ncbi:MAG: helix-turn-helix transcriptional regulator [Clostridia bacterium]|nr:helix-turn-helix transcriptional regulator [Clostridia bacterium]
MKDVTLEFMRFYSIAYAHAHTANDYKYRVSTCGFGNYQQPETAYAGILELGIVELNPLIITDISSGESFTVGEGDIFVLPPEHIFEVRGKNPGQHKHTSVEFLIDSHFVGDKAAGNDSVITLPYLIKGSKKSEAIAHTIRKIVADKTFLEPKNYFDELCDLAHLFSEIKKYIENKDGKTVNENISPSCQRYCRMAEEYIAENMSTRVSMTELAHHIGINKNYLTTIFTLYKGMPISEYIIKMKLNYMLELIFRFDYTLKQAGEFIGMPDENYISTVFKKYYGMTFKKYKMLHGGKSEK